VKYQIPPDELVLTCVEGVERKDGSIGYEPTLPGRWFFVRMEWSVYPYMIVTPRYYSGISYKFSEGASHFVATMDVFADSKEVLLYRGRSGRLNIGRIPAILV